MNDTSNFDQMQKKNFLASIGCTFKLISKPHVTLYTTQNRLRRLH